MNFQATLNGFLIDGFLTSKSVWMNEHALDKLQNSTRAASSLKTYQVAQQASALILQSPTSKCNL